MRQRLRIVEIAFVFGLRQRQRHHDFDAESQGFLGRELVAAGGQRRDQAQRKERERALQLFEEATAFRPQARNFRFDQVAVRGDADVEVEPCPADSVDGKPFLRHFPRPPLVPAATLADPRPCKRHGAGPSAA